MGPSKHRLVKDSQYSYDWKWGDMRFKAMLRRSYEYGRERNYVETEIVTWIWDHDLEKGLNDEEIMEKLLNKIGMTLNDMYMDSCNSWKLFVPGESHKFENY